MLVYNSFYDSQSQSTSRTANYQAIRRAVRGIKYKCQILFVDSDPIISNHNMHMAVFLT